MCFQAFFLVDIAVIGSLEWDPAKGGYVALVTSESETANYIMAIFCETHVSRGFAIFFTGNKFYFFLFNIRKKL